MHQMMEVYLQNVRISTSTPVGDLCSLEKVSSEHSSLNHLCQSVYGNLVFKTLLFCLKPSIRLKHTKTETYCNFNSIRFLKLALILLSLSFSWSSSLGFSLTNESDLKQTSNQPLYGNEDFTFARNGSFLQIDAGHEWPFNSRREISFKFKTNSPHGLLIYQTFDHNKLLRDEEQEMIESGLLKPERSETKAPPSEILQTAMARQLIVQDSFVSSISKRKRRSILLNAVGDFNIHHLNARLDTNVRQDSNAPPLAQLASNTITATASEKLVNSLFSAANIATTNSLQRGKSILQPVARDKILVSAHSSNGISSRDSSIGVRNRIISGITSNRMSEAVEDRGGFELRGNANNNGVSTVISSSTISSLSASLYELYLKLENGRLKIVYEFGSRLNQTYCGKGLNDARWHRIDLKVDPEINQMVLVLDQTVTVEIVLSQPQHEDDTTRRNELVFTNSVLYMGGLSNNASVVKSVRQRLYLAQFIGCIGNIMLKNDQNTESSLQPAPIDRAVLVKRGCRNLCDTDNFCLHKASCLNYYTHTKCDCFGTNHEDVYCWQRNLTTLSMFGYSTLVYRIYDWRDRHHSSINRFSIQFKTLAPDSILFFAYGDLSAQQPMKSSSINLYQSSTFNPLNLSTLNISSLPTIHRPNGHQIPANNNYLAVSLSNGSIVVEVNFGDQPILLSNLLYEKQDSAFASLSKTKIANLSDNQWHNVTITHNVKQIALYVDNFMFSTTIVGKNNHLYFDPSIYIGSIPNFLHNETRALIRPLNLRHKYVGCLRSIYFNQHDILLALKQNSQMVEYRDIIGKPKMDHCLVSEPSSLPLTLRSGKSYLTFQLSSQTTNARSDSSITHSNLMTEPSKSFNTDTIPTVNQRKLTKIEFEYKTLLHEHFLAGGHLRDLNYHDLGGFWTLHARTECRLYFTISSGLTSDPEQVLVLDPKNKSCEPGTWYRVSISIVPGERSLNITRLALIYDQEDQTNNDSFETGTYTLDSSVELLHQVQLGGDLAKFGETSSIPFSGCIRRIKINGNSFDSRDFVSSSLTSIQAQQIANFGHYNLSSATFAPLHRDLITSRMAQGYVTIDSCQLVNPCATLNPCKNGGICKINELGDPDCDCSKTGYAGRRCHFSIYKSSCQDLFLSGQRKSSYYLIDLDRNGPLKPIRVRCNMESDQNQIETSLSHNLPAEYLIRRSTTSDIVLDVTYLAFHHMYTHDGFYVHDDTDETMRENQNIMLRTMIAQSLYCKQYFRHECRLAPLFLGNRTWMEVPYPKSHKLISLDGQNVGKCACASTEKKCLDPAKGCNCDSGEFAWADDSFELNDQTQVGVTRIVMLKQDARDYLKTNGQSTIGNTESQSRFTLSDLKCYGTKEHGNQHVITFKTSDAYIEVPGWRRGDISFSFRTASNPPAIVLYQLATSRNHGYFRLTLMTDTRLLFEFIVNRKPRKLSLIAAHKLNNGEWQQIFIEYDSANLRLTVNDDSVFVDLDLNDHLGTFEGPLFIGGAPSKYLVGELSRRNGFTGCFKGLNINGRSIDLNDYLSPSMPTVISGCQPSCTKNLCQNGGKCIEYWGSYECECLNSIAHSGSNCEINLNTNSITFVTPESHYVEQSNDTAVYAPYLTKSILLNIRTYQESSLVLYAYDRLNNFIQLHKNGSSLVLTFNSNSTITVVRVPIDDEINADIASPLTKAQPQLPSQETTTPVPSNSTQPTLAHNNSTILSNSKQNSQLNFQIGSRLEFDKSIKVSNTSGKGQPIQIKIERHRLRTAFYVNNNFVVVEKPLIFLTNYSQTPWINPELELVKPSRSKSMSRVMPKLYLANIDENFTTRLPGFTGCIQGLSIDNQLFDFNRAHLFGELRGDYKIGCKMHCDSFPCRNQGICIENWKEDKIECKCDSTSYVGRICDEDIAAIFNGKTSHFIYHLQSKPVAPRRNQINSRSESTIVPLNISEAQPENETRKAITDLASNIDVAKPSYSVNFLEVTLAFSTDSNQSLTDHRSGMQVLVLITKANSSKHFFLGLTQDGSLMIQEDYGNSMSLSRLIERSDQPFNDGYRHMVKYSRFEQSIQINIDHQTYLPTMSVIATHHITKLSKSSLLLIGTSTSSYQALRNPLADKKERDNDDYLDFSGCISNIKVKMDDLTIEPFNVAFGQNLETINVTSPSTKADENRATEPAVKMSTENSKFNENQKLIGLLNTKNEVSEDYSAVNFDKLTDLSSMNRRLLRLVDKNNGQEVGEDIETIIARDVEQGKCALFKKIENSNEKRSVNEPKYTSLLEPRPAYMDPPRVKPFKVANPTANTESMEHNLSIGAIFYISLTFLTIVSMIVSAYAYKLQIRYKSEKFKCETPFFHNKRDDLENNQTSTG